MLMGMYYIHDRAGIGKVVVSTHIGVSSRVARSTMVGNARASMSVNGQ